MLNFVPFCYWKGAKFAEKIYIFWAILTCVVDALSKSLLCWGKVRKCTCNKFFLCKVLRHKDSLPFPREKIDSGVLWHNFGIFTHTEVRVFFFFLNKYTITRIITIGTYWSVYKAERDTYKFTVYNVANLTISTFRSMYKAERDTYKFTVYNFANLTISTFWSMHKAERQDVYFAILIKY